jgi:polysaccharide export outer membrane protein
MNLLYSPALSAHSLLRRVRALLVIGFLGAVAGCSTVTDLAERVVGPGTPDPNLTAAIADSESYHSADYRVGAEDVLEISVWKEDNLKKDVLVRPDGGLSFPLAGDFHAAGMTTEEIRQELVRRLEKYIPEPVVSVSVTKASNYKVYVLGRVNKPGDLTSGRPLDVLQALSMAGGLTPFASEADIRIIRKVDGRPISIPFNYSHVRQGEDLDQNVLLKSGDVLVVP